MLAIMQDGFLLLLSINKNGKPAYTQVSMHQKRCYENSIIFMISFSFR